jgi:hypothetical protein
MLYPAMLSGTTHLVRVAAYRLSHAHLDRADREHGILGGGVVWGDAHARNGPAAICHMDRGESSRERSVPILPVQSGGRRERSLRRMWPRRSLEGVSQKGKSVLLSQHALPEQ